MKKLTILLCAVAIHLTCTSQNYAPFLKKNGKYIFVYMLEKKPAFEKEYDDVRPFSDGMAWVKRGNEQGYIDNKGNEIAFNKYETYPDFSNGVAAVSIKGKYGFIDRTGKEITPLRYGDVKKFSEGFCAVRDHQYWGFVDSTGKEICITGTNFEYKEAWAFHNGYAKVQLLAGGKFTYVDKTGKQMGGLQFRDARDFSEGLAAVEVMADVDYRYGFIDVSGKFVIPAKYKAAWRFSDGIAVVTKENNKQALIDKNGKEIADFSYKNESGYYHGLVAVKYDGKFSFVNNKGKLVKYEGEAYGLPGEGLVYLKKLDKQGERMCLVFNNEMQPVSDFLYEFVFDFHDGWARVKRNGGKTGFINKAGKEMIPVQYYSAKDFSNGFAKVSDMTGKNFYIDVFGREFFEK